VHFKDTVEVPPLGVCDVAETKLPYDRLQEELACAGAGEV
jgi:hypothetical protein